MDETKDTNGEQAEEKEDEEEEKEEEEEIKTVYADEIVDSVSLSDDEETRQQREESMVIIILDKRIHSFFLQLSQRKWKRWNWRVGGRKQLKL